jgi:hypothetical protein
MSAPLRVCIVNRHVRCMFEHVPSTVVIKSYTWWETFKSNLGTPPKNLISPHLDWRLCSGPPKRTPKDFFTDFIGAKFRV